jgi:nitrous oxide reductase accessory protein NosL
MLGVLSSVGRRLRARALTASLALAVASLSGAGGATGGALPTVAIGSLGALAALAAAPALLAGCGRDRATRPRCARCGMYADTDPAFRAGATSADGQAVHFDSPRCLMQWLASDAARGAEAPWVTEYYGQRKAPAAFCWYVIGSDVVGPMGPDLIPLADEPSARRFAEEHGGRRVLRFDEIDAAAIEESARPPGATGGGR